MKKINCFLLLLSLITLVLLSACTKMQNNQSLKVDVSLELENKKETFADEELNQEENLDDLFEIEEVVTESESQKNKEKTSSYFRIYRNWNTVGDESYEDIFIEKFNKMGEVIWDHSWKGIRGTELESASEPLTYEDRVYIAVVGTLYCLDNRDGEILWENSEDVGGATKIYPYKGRIYLTSYYGNAIMTCLDKDSGAKIWAIEDDDMYWGYDIFSRDDEIIVCYGGDEVNYISANYKDGQIINQWTGESVSYDNTYDNVKWDRAKASSVLENNQAKYGAKNIIDNNTQTAWAEGVKGHGVGEWIQVERDGVADINRIYIGNGYHKSQETYDNNSSLKKFRLDFSNGQYIYYEVEENKAESNFIEINFDGPISTDFIKLTILDVYKGGKYEDTCVTYIEVY